jgi:hypothetical protein
LRTYLVDEEKRWAGGRLAAGGWWFFILLIGWGIGLEIHALNVFAFGGRMGQGWEECKTREFMDKERAR